MRAVQKIALSLLISVVAFSLFALFAYSGFFSFIESNFYDVRVRQQIVQRLDSTKNAVSEYTKHYLDRFGTVVAQSSVKRIDTVNQSAQDIFDRKNLFQKLLADYPGILFVRFVDNHGNIHFSTLESDVLRSSQYQTVYKTLNRADPTTKYAKELESTSKTSAVYIDSKDKRLLFRLPWIGYLGDIVGSAAFYVGISDLQAYLVKQGEMEPAKQLLPIGDSGFVFGSNLTNNAKLEEEIAKYWKSQANEPSKGLPVASDASGAKLFLFTAKTDSLGYLGDLVPQADFSLNKTLQVLLSVTIFLTVFLLTFLILSLRQDKLLVLADRIKRFQISFLKEYLESKSTLDWARWHSELELRRSEVRREIKRGIGKIGKEREATVDGLIDKSWDEILSVIGKRVDEEPASQREVRGLEEAIRRLLSSGELATSRGIAAPPVRTPSAVPAGAEAPGEVEEAEAVEELEEVEEAEPLEEADTEAEAASIEEVEEAEPVEEVEEVEEAEAVEELEEVEAGDEIEEVSEAESVEEAGTAAEPGARPSTEALTETEEAAPIEEVEEAEPVEEAEAVEELEEVEAGDEVEEVSEAEPGARPSTEALTETEEAASIEELEEAEPVEELDALEEVDALDEEEMGFGGVNDLEKVEALDLEAIFHGDELLADIDIFEDMEQGEEEQEPAEAELVEEGDAEEVEAVDQPESIEAAAETVSVGRTTKESDRDLDELAEELEELEEVEPLEATHPDIARLVQEGEDEELEQVEVLEPAEKAPDLSRVEIGTVGEGTLQQVSYGFSLFKEFQETRAPALTGIVDRNPYAQLLEVEKQGSDGDAGGDGPGGSPHEGSHAGDDGESAPMDSAPMEDKEQEVANAEEVEELEEAKTLGEGGEIEEIETFDEVDEAEPIEGPEELPGADLPGSERGAERASTGGSGTGTVEERAFEKRIRDLIGYKKIEVYSLTDVKTMGLVPDDAIEISDGVFQIREEVVARSAEQGNEELKDLVDSVVARDRDDEGRSQIGELLSIPTVELSFEGLVEQGGDEEKKEPAPRLFGSRESRKRKGKRVMLTQNGFDYDSFRSEYKSNNIGIMKSLMRLSQKVDAIYAAVLTPKDDGLVAEFSLGLDDRTIGTLRFDSSDAALRNLFLQKSLVYIRIPKTGIPEFDSKIGSKDIRFMKGTIYLPIIFDGKQGYLFFGLKNTDPSIQDYMLRIIK